MYLHGSGAEMGLTVIIEHNDEEYQYFLDSNLATYVYVFETLDFPHKRSGAITERIISPGQELFLSIHPKSIIGLDGVKNINKKLRGCVFSDEQLIQFNGFYTFSECYLSCLVEDLIRTCKCCLYTVPLAFNVENIPECSLLDILCVHQWRRSWANVESQANKDKSTVESQCAHCLPTCTIVKYNVQSSHGFINSKLLSKTR